MAEMEHNGFVIVMNSRKEFTVVELERDYESWKLATEAIERHQAEAARAKKVKFDVAVLAAGGRTGEFTEHKLVGVHAGHKHVTLKPAADRHGRLYLDHPEARKALERLVGLCGQMEEVEEFLERFRIEAPSGYSNSYDTVVEGLAKSIAEAQKVKAKFDV